MKTYTAQFFSSVDVNLWVTFFGDNLDTLFITTSGNEQTGEHDGCDYFTLVI